MIKEKNYNKFDTPKDDSTSYVLRKKILGSPKLFDLPFHKNVLERTLGTCKTYSSSHLGTSTCRNSKV